jgi:hypothetical protein
MRYAKQLQLRERILGELPSATVTPAYDGPAGYVLVVAGPDFAPVTVKSDADWRRLAARLKKLAGAPA